MAHIRKRGKTYSYTIDLGKDHATGKRKQINKGGFIRKKDAEAAARKIESAMDENRYIEPSKEIFSNFIRDWFYEHYQNRVEETTVLNRKYILEKHILINNHFTNKALSSITTSDIDAFYNQKVKEEYSTSYIRQMHQMLNQAFNQAVKWGKVLNNPVMEADPPAVKYEEIFIWSLDEIHLFLKACKGERHYLTFLLAIYTGMRRGEILGLKWSDIDFTKKIIRVNRSLAYNPKVGYKFTQGKTKNSKRHIPIPEFVLNVLKSHREMQDTWIELVGELYHNQDLVICTNSGTEQNPQNLIRVMKRIIKKADVRVIRFHDIRHTHASILISEGVDIVKISNRLGHANPKITLEYYAHLLPSSHSEVADIFHDAILNHINE